MHEEISSKAIDILKNLEEVDKIILYGSVLRGDYNKNSDIDLAFICDDFYRNFPLDIEGNPNGLRQKIDDSLKEIQEKHNIKIQVPIYWNQDFEKRIALLSARNNQINYLNDIGKIVYNSQN